MFSLFNGLYETLYLIIIGTSHLASTRIVGDKPYYKRSSLLHDYDYDFTNRRVFNDVNYLSYYSKNRDAVKADDTGKSLSTILPSHLTSILYNYIF